MGGEVYFSVVKLKERCYEREVEKEKGHDLLTSGMFSGRYINGSLGSENSFP